MINRILLLFLTVWVGTLGVIGCSHFPKNDLWKGYTLTWLGTAGWKVGYREKTVLIDPYLSRISGKNSQGKEDWNQIWKSNTESIEFALRKANISEVDVILVSHSHFDHFGDVPYLLKKFPNAIVYGSSTTCNILAAVAPMGKCVDVSKETLVHLPNLSIKAVPTLHSFAGPDQKLPFAGKISTPPKSPLKISDYVEGGSTMFYLQGEGIDFLFQGSANFIESEMDALHPKTAVIATVLYKNVDHYQVRLLGKLHPRNIILNHFDNFFLPYSAGMLPLDEKELNQFITELREFDSTIDLTVPQFFQEIKIED